MNTAEKVFKTARGDIHYYVTIDAQCPNKPWMIFLHGLTAEHHLFDLQLDYFHSSYNCLSWDAPAHGDSRPYAKDFTLDEMATLLHDILLSEKIDRPIMIGQSYGGYLTQAYEFLYPNEIAAFISIDSCCLKKKYNAWWVTSSLKHTKGMYMMIPWKILVPWSMKIATSEVGKKNYREAMLKFSKKEFCELSGRGFASIAEAIEKDRAYEMHCPVLLFCGTKDVAGVTKKLNQKWSQGEGYPLLMVPGGGHNSNIDCPEFVNSSIEDFLAKNI